jgi:hypothetical protein
MNRRDFLRLSALAGLYPALSLGRGRAGEMMMNEAEFFEAFDAERWEFTYMDELDITKPIIQVDRVQRV